jgi:demethylmenaquinone methyltransferase/2-methoxy-6-polyprenyl-1,4-benzoquinol methylase
MRRETMDKNGIKEFFDRCAPSWDDHQKKDDSVIADIMDNAGVERGTRVLDVACGTGVLFEDYISRNAGHVIGVDISPKMAEIASGKASGYENIDVICADVEELPEAEYDVCMVYNAFPHFFDPESLIESLAGQLKKGGVLSVAHGAGRETINHHHEGAAAPYSIGLLPADELSELMERWFSVYCVISDDRMYQVCGKKR